MPLPFVVLWSVELCCFVCIVSKENREQEKRSVKFRQGKDGTKKFFETMAVKVKSRALDGRDGPTRPNLLA